MCGGGGGGAFDVLLGNNFLEKKVFLCKSGWLKLQAILPPRLRLDKHEL